MSDRAKRGIAATCVVALLVGLGIYGLLSMRGTAATAQAMPDVGKFRVGSDLGEERAGFSGRAKVQVFATASASDWTALSACLQSAAVEAEMPFFTGILVDEKAEPEVEATLREQDGQRVVVRGLQGQVLGSLPAGFACDDLVSLLKQAHAVSTRAPEPSPIYASLLESTAALDDLIQKQEGAKAAKFIDLLEEFEGSASPAVQAAKAKLGK